RRLVVRPGDPRAASVRGVEVGRDDLRGIAVLDDLAALEPDRTVAELVDRLHVVRDEHDRAPGSTQVLHATEAALLELRVDDAEHLAFGNGEADVAERPDLLLLLLLFGAADGAGCGARKRVAERPVRSLELSDPVSLRDLLRFDRERHQIVSAKRGSKLRNTASPTVKSAIATETLTAIWPQFGVASPSSAQ